METLLGIVFFSIVFVGIYKGGWALVNFLDARFPERAAKNREKKNRAAALDDLPKDNSGFKNPLGVGIEVGGFYYGDD